MRNMFVTPAEAAEIARSCVVAGFGGHIGPVIVCCVVDPSLMHARVEPAS